MDEVTQPSRPVVQPEDMRAGDADRERVLDRLRAAHTEGRLDLVEFDERIAATLAARTYRELVVITADLPAAPTAVVPVSTALPTGGSGTGVEPRSRERDFRSGVMAWAGVSATTAAIWAVSCIVQLTLFPPWWLWVAGPWGAVLLVSWIGMRLQRG